MHACQRFHICKHICTLAGGFIYTKEITINTFNFYTKWLHLRTLPHVTCATDYIGRVTERNEFHWVHYDLDGPAHLDPTYTGTGIYYRSIYWSKIYRYRLRVPVPVQGFRGFSVLKLIWFNSRNNCSTGAKVKYRFTCWSIMIILHDLSCINLQLKIRVITWLVCNSEFADRMHDDRLTGCG